MTQNFSWLLGQINGTRLAAGYFKKYYQFIRVVQPIITPHAACQPVSNDALDLTRMTPNFSRRQASPR